MVKIIDYPDDFIQEVLKRFPSHTAIKTAVIEGNEYLGNMLYSISEQTVTADEILKTDPSLLYKNAFLSVVAGKLYEKWITIWNHQKHFNPDVIEKVVMDNLNHDNKKSTRTITKHTKKTENTNKNIGLF